jgi:hypothetical protein
VKTHVEFRTALFPAYPDEAARINPERYGRRLAEFLQRELPHHGVTTGTIWSEDWGWAVGVKNDAFKLWIGCGNAEGQLDDMICFIEPSKPVLRRFLFRRIDAAPDVERVARAVDKLLVSTAGITDVRWW